MSRSVDELTLLQGYLVREMDTPSLLSILQSVPETVHSDLLGRWVSSYIIPFALQHLPQSMVSKQPGIALCVLDFVHDICRVRC